MSAPPCHTLQCVDWECPLPGLYVDCLKNSKSTPASFSSGEKLRQSRLTYRGHKEIRVMMIEAAWTAIRVDPALSLCYETLKKRMIGQKANVRIARKLLSRIRYILLHKIPYEKGIVS